MNTIKIASATPTIQVANCRHNAEQVLELMHRAEHAGASLLLLPKMCLTGATCGSLLQQRTLINSAQQNLETLVAASTNKNIITIIGLPIIVKDEILQVSAVFGHGRIYGFLAEKNPQEKWPSVIWKGSVFPYGERLDGIVPGYSICTNFNIGQDTDEALIILRPTAEPEILGAAKKRRLEAKLYSKRSIYVQASAGWGESTTDAAYAGHNIIAHFGEIIHESTPFGSGWAVAEMPVELPPERGKSMYIPVYEMSDESLTPAKHPFVKMCPNPQEALDIQAAGLAQRLRHTGANTAVLGISGGLDSTLALLVTAQAFDMLGKSRGEIQAITMPCFGTTARTKNNAHALCEALGIPCREIDIRAAVTQHLLDIGHPEGVYDVVFENAQARMRTMVLMNVANQQNGLVVGTGSLSELALGWATYNGDHMSMYAVNAGVPKTLVRHLVEHMAQTPVLREVLASILATKVSPELLPTVNDEITQITEEVVGPYELHDFFIYHGLHHKCPPSVVFTQARKAFDNYSPSEVMHWLEIFYRRFFSQQFKRNCLPDGPQVVDISLSPRTGIKMPSDASANAWLEELQGIRL